MRNPLAKPLSEGVPVYAPPISTIGQLLGINAREVKYGDETDVLIIFAYIAATLAGAVLGAIVATIWLY